MSELAVHSTPAAAAGRPNLDDEPHAATLPVFLLLLVCGLGYAIYGLLRRWCIIPIAGAGR